MQCGGAVKSDAKNAQWLGRERGSYFHVAHSCPWLALVTSHTEFSLTWTASRCKLAWENSRHFRDATLVSPWSEIWETTAEISYWWRINTQIWVVRSIGWSKFPSQHGPIEKNYPDLGSNELSVWNFATCRLFSQAKCKFIGTIESVCILKKRFQLSGFWTPTGQDLFGKPTWPPFYRWFSQWRHQIVKSR